MLYYKDAKGLMCWTAFLKRPSSGEGPKPGGHEAAAATGGQALQAAPSKPAPKNVDLGGDDFEFKLQE